MEWKRPSCDVTEPYCDAHFNYTVTWKNMVWDEHVMKVDLVLDQNLRPKFLYNHIMIFFDLWSVILFAWTDFIFYSFILSNSILCLDYHFD